MTAPSSLLPLQGSAALPPLPHSRPWDIAPAPASLPAPFRSSFPGSSLRSECSSLLSSLDTLALTFQRSFQQHSPPPPMPRAPCPVPRANLQAPALPSLVRGSFTFLLAPLSRLRAILLWQGLCRSADQCLVQSGWVLRFCRVNPLKSLAPVPWPTSQPSRA